MGCQERRKGQWSKTKGKGKKEKLKRQAKRKLQSGVGVTVKITSATAGVRGGSKKEGKQFQRNKTGSFVDALRNHAVP